ncbi:hypothetical protein SE00_07580 [Staphylococcus saprophyticus]|mgnify:FL=1|uniref:phage tail assembly chaperone G n=1 Tax=Staphylococcus TaxID=1279 RepID=UPI000597D22F|nr:MULTISPECIES: hypothetical protein [Staphylococcus]KIJ86813.1 hypothetical protein SE00_07580 [Staphylococcus saprophyticus]MDT4050363.1 hypothetical protein [Staphylococcus arlettae]PUZ31078.1 hypothetical protein BU606_12240 [Staphylococcus arlettae]
MAKKYIELQNEQGEKQKFHQPAFIKGSVARKGMRIGKKASKLQNPEGLDDNFEDEFLDELYNFVANDLYDGQFTAQEFEDGLDVHEVMNVAMEQLASVMGDDEGKTKK